MRPDDPTNALSQGADLAVLPTIAFGGLQILREGATAQYGTDAIAGVMNYSLKKEEGVEINTRYGQYLDDGGDGDGQTDCSLSRHGIGRERLHLVRSRIQR